MEALLEHTSSSHPPEFCVLEWKMPLAGVCICDRVRGLLLGLSLTLSFLGYESWLSSTS